MDLKTKTTEKLKAELNGLKVITGALIGVLGVLFIFCIYGMMTKEDNAFFISMIVVPIALSAIIPINYGKIKNIKLELESRQ